jgi:hypothetical protein
MRRGSIAIGEMKCDICTSTIEHGQRYMMLEEEKKSKTDTGIADTTELPVQRICLNCCIKKKYVAKKKDKGEEIYTFFAE